MTKQLDKRQENETIKDWLKRISIDDSERLLKKWKHRQKYEWFYSFIFNAQVKYLSLKRRIKKFKFYT